MIDWTPVLSVLYACVLYFCVCTCSAQLSMFHMERHSRNTLIVISIIIIKIFRLICNFYLSVAAHKIVFEDRSLRYTSMLLGH